MANASVTAPLNNACAGFIERRLFDLGCLGPALAIILILASLKRREKCMLDYCGGYPGLVIPVNFLGTFKNRFSIAATFGVTASTCLKLFLKLSLKSEGGLFISAVSPWLKVFQKIITVFVYGIIFYPFFACLTTNYTLVGSLMGFLYAAIRFSFKFVIDLQCANVYTDETRKLQYLQLLAFAPEYLCLLFVLVRFAVLLFTEVRKKWFTDSSRDANRTGESGVNCLVGKREIEHINMLLNPGRNRSVASVKWFMKPLYLIYQPRPDFKFSTQFISTLVVAAIAIFEILVSFLEFFDALRKLFIRTCRSDFCKTFVNVLCGGCEGALVLSSVISVILLLHFMKCHRDHVLQLYRGKRTFYQDVCVSPTMLVGRSLKFSGYQIAYSVAGFLVLWIPLAIMCITLGITFTDARNFIPQAIWNKLGKFGLTMLPIAVTSFLLWLFQLFLAYFVFRDKDFAKISVAVDNRRLYSILLYFFFFYNVLLGGFSFLSRILRGMVLGLLFLPRLDRSFFLRGFQNWDRAFVAYLGFINVVVAHSHPVVLLFCQLLIDRNKDRLLEESLPQVQLLGAEASIEERDTVERSWLLADTSLVSPFDVLIREPRLPRFSQKAMNRWLVAVTLLRNPSLLKYRRQGGVTPVVNLSSVNFDIANVM